MKKQYKKFTNIFSLFAIVLLTSCSQKYTASFTHSDYNRVKSDNKTEIVPEVTQIESTPSIEEAIEEITKPEILNRTTESLTASVEKVPYVTPNEKLVTPTLEKPATEISKEKQAEILEKLNNMNRAEKRELRKEVKNTIRNLEKDNPDAGVDDNLLLLIIVTILIPPLGVGLVYGITTEFWISLILTLLGYLPGLIYSLIVITR